eukprot:UN19095
MSTTINLGIFIFCFLHVRKNLVGFIIFDISLKLSFFCTHLFQKINSFIHPSISHKFW